MLPEPPKLLPLTLMAHLLEAPEETLEDLDQSNDTPAHEPLFNVVLLNDDHHTDVYVVEMLGRLFFIAPAQAFRHAVEVDTTGRTILITCEHAQAQFARDQIHAFGPDPRIKTCSGSMSAIVEPAPK
jgi:ATP-dependent Clp protease adaptor protein ClpS